MARPFVLFVLFVATALALAAQDVQLGTVTDAESGMPIGGASIRVQGTTRGTYTRSDGTFRLPLTSGMATLLVRSIGYKETTLATAPSQNLSIKLTSAGLTKGVVEVMGDIEPSEVVRRAIARAKENDERLRTLVSTTYSKMRVYIDTPNFGQESEPKESITETFSKVYYQRYPERAKRVHILQRRQTRNIAAADNLAVFDEFIDITQTAVQIFKTRLVTPLGPDALDVYNYKIVSRRPLGDKIVYEMKFEPKSRLFPGFEGTLSIVDGTYQTVAADFSPTEETAFPFVKHMRYAQRYEQVNDSIWVPMYQLISADAAVNIISGLSELALKLSIEAYVTDVEANVRIADSMLHQPADTISGGATAQNGGVSVRVEQEAGKWVTVAKDADTSRPEFWDQHAFTEMSDEEREAYRVADSVVANRPPRTGESKPRIGLITLGPLGINVLPIITRTTITGWTFGGELEFVVGPASLATSAAWGKNGTNLGSVDVEVGIINSKAVDAKIVGSVFSTYQTIQPPRPILGKPNFLNLNDLLYMEYNDYFRRDGWSTGVAVASSMVDAELTFSWTRHLADSIITTVSRDVVRPDVGNYQTVRLHAEINKPSFFGEYMGDERPVFGSIGGTIGRETATDAGFATIDGTLSLRLPTFSTGYQPMHLDIDVSGAMVLTDSAPRQYQSSLLKRFPAIGTTTDLATVPINRYGGNASLVVHAEHNFTDLWWRALGIPTLGNGRGVDLIVLYGAGITRNTLGAISSNTWLKTPIPYMEAGFALSRIPTFISDLAFLRFDALWPVGGLGHVGTFGWSITLSSPLF